MRLSRRLSGSIFAFGLMASLVEDCTRYVLLVTISRWMDFMLQLRSISSTASQSSNSGWEGDFPLMPKLNTVGTSAWPKWRSHM